MKVIEFKNAEILSLETELDKVKKGDCWYLLGDGVLVKNLTENEADDLKVILKKWLIKNKKIIKSK